MRVLLMLLAVVAMAAIPAAAQQTTTEKPAKAVANPAQPAGPTAPLVNINTATQTQLESLPGLGPKVAARILEYRQKNGSFKKVEDLMNVKGIGEKSFLKLKPLLRVTDKPVADKAGPSGV